MRRDVIIFLCNHFLSFSESSQELERLVRFFIFTLLHIYCKPELRQLRKEEMNVLEKDCCLFALIPCAIDIYSRLYCIDYNVFYKQMPSAGL